MAIVASMTRVRVMGTGVHGVSGMLGVRVLMHLVSRVLVVRRVPMIVLVRVIVQIHNPFTP
jgi:hypothetical protein